MMKISRFAHFFLTLAGACLYRGDMSSQREFYADAEIASQPEIWRRTADFAPTVAHLLPRAGEKIAVVGCGSSWFLSQAYASLREAAGQGESDAFTASEYIHTRSYDRVLAISRSGTTTETVDLLANLEGVVPTIALTAVSGSPVTQRATESIVMDFADEGSVVQTRWVTASLGLLRTQFGLNLRELSVQAEVALQESLGELPQMEEITFIGTGWTVALASEAALKTREAAQFWAESYPAMDYRHGPLSISQPGRAVWAFGEIEGDLIADIKRTGALFESSALDPMAHLIKAQRLAVALARQRGLNPDYPRNLSRSIILK
jgi:fructoselysine-6-P-deglycase FrlB-like protein